MTAVPKIPNFFVVGAGKAGTTSIYDYLDQHDQIFMSPLKETNYFSLEMRPENLDESMRPRTDREMADLRQYLLSDMREKRFGGLICDWNDYLLLFKNATDESAIGEVTPHYLWSESAPRLIAAQIPRAKIIISLRNPIDRAFSQYLHMLTAGATRKSFREQVRVSSSHANARISLDWPFLEFGLYYQQVQRYLSFFPSSQVHISFYEELQHDPALLMSKLFTFLGVNPDCEVDTSRRLNEPRVPRFGALLPMLRKAGIWPYLSKWVPLSLRPRLTTLAIRPRESLVMNSRDHAYLAEYYREDVERLSSLLDRDCRGWLAPRGAMRVARSESP
jgi:Sulfotransferase family